jgi:hypothetical protein
MATRRPGTWMSWCVIFAAINLLLNSRLGRNVDEVVTDWVVRGWHQLRMRIFAAVFRFIADAFAQMLEGLERVFYTVDEWLRFRRGDPRIAAVLKAIFGVAWFFVTYVVRFCVTLLIEPQVNPIKHFPVVTVSHKFILPFQPVLAGVLETQLGFNRVEGNTVAGAIVFGIPGIFGFLVWELKENWRIFAANRPQTLRPATVGRKGETMVRLLRPGFHSGTVPKLFARLRRADRKAYATGNWAPPRKHREKLHQVQVAVTHFVEREMLVLLELSERWPMARLQIQRVHLGLANVEFELVCNTGDHSAASHEPLRLEFEERRGWLVAGTNRPAWMAELPLERGEALAAAITGLFKFAGVELVREQIASRLPSGDGREYSYQIVDDGIRVTVIGMPGEAIYNLRSPDLVLVPQGSPVLVAALPALPRADLAFFRDEIPWQLWVARWNVACREPCDNDVRNVATADTERSVTVARNEEAPSA